MAAPAAPVARESVIEYTRRISDLIYINIDPVPGFTGCLPTFANTQKLTRQILPLGSGKHYVGVILVRTTLDPVTDAATKEFDMWGVCPITKLILDLDTVEEVSPTSAPDLILRVTYRRSDFVHPRTVRAITRESIACIRYPVMRSERSTFRGYLPPEPICIEDVPGLLKARINQYIQPTEACICSTENELRQDRLSYMLMLSSMSMLDQKEPPLYPGTKPGWRYICDSWLRGEMKIARFRATWHNASNTYPGDTDPERPDLRGRPWHTAPALFVSGVARSPLGYLRKGVIFAPAAMWAPTILLETEKNHLLNLNTYRPSHHRDHAELTKLLRTHGSMQIHARMGARFYGEADAPSVTGKRKAEDGNKSDWRRPARGGPATSRPSGQPIAELADLKPLKDAGQLMACSPQCMKALAVEAFTDCGPGKHLRHSDRTIFYPYVFANGLEIEHVQPMMTERARLSKPDYDVRKIDAALKNAHRYVRESGAHPIGCTKLQTTHSKYGRPFCPFMSTATPAETGFVGEKSPLDEARADARRACTRDMRDTFVASGIQNAQDLSWKHSNFPLVFAQRVRRVLVVEYEKEAATAAAAANAPAPMDME